MLRDFKLDCGLEIGITPEEQIPILPKVVDIGEYMILEFRGENISPFRL
jgi:hypothetical protein